mmetsp:Transcript_42452/g.83310  ORF Transcript_42452/g.83310 Transcript_42452/m.83310 type:complete len:202 (+) Transcript_42452:1098-1703(+)
MFAKHALPPVLLGPTRLLLAVLLQTGSAQAVQWGISAATDAANSSARLAPLQTRQDRKSARSVRLDLSVKAVSTKSSAGLGKWLPFLPHLPAISAGAGSHTMLLTPPVLTSMSVRLGGRSVCLQKTVSTAFTHLSVSAKLDLLPRRKRHSQQWLAFWTGNSGYSSAPAVSFLLLLCGYSATKSAGKSQRGNLLCALKRRNG